MIDPVTAIAGATAAFNTITETELAVTADINMGIKKKADTAAF